VFLATPIEADNWGRWMVSGIPALHHWRQHAQDKVLFCRCNAAWQKEIMRFLDIDPEAVMAHDVTRPYFCHSLQTLQYSQADFAVSDNEKALFQELADRCMRTGDGPTPERVFLARLSISQKHPHYRVLQNEAELAEGLAARGYAVVEPEQLSVPDKIRLLAGARSIVATGGAGLFSAVFCRPGATVVTLESSGHFVIDHTRMLASLRHRVGVIFGRQDPADPQPVHKRWTIDVPKALAAIDAFV
jgi:capsular polysaccharide biosynthesis protein